MKKINSILLKYLLKLFLVFAFFAFLLIGVGLIIKQKIYGSPHQRWQHLNKPSFNIFKFFGFKWCFLLFLTALIVGHLYRYPVWQILEYRLQTKRFFEFAKTVHMAVVSADVGRGKTLLLSILADNLPHGIKKVGFVSNVPSAQLLSYNDINFHEPISRKDNYRLNKYFFLDETNFWIEGVEHQKNRLYHKGVAFLLQIIRHHKTRLWISATRDNHVWIHVREIVNYFVKLGGLKKLMRIAGITFYTQTVKFYNQSWELVKEFTILIPSWDFNLYDSYWLSCTSVFRPILEEKVEHFKPNWEELSEEDKKFEEEAELAKQKLIGENNPTILQLSKQYNLNQQLLIDFHKVFGWEEGQKVLLPLLEGKKQKKGIGKKEKSVTKLPKSEKKFTCSNCEISFKEKDLGGETKKGEICKYCLKDLKKKVSEKN